MTTNLKLKLKWGPETHLQLQIIATGATKVFENLQDYNFKLTISTIYLLLLGILPSPTLT